MDSRKPILVTGTHRSGTTWVGRMLAASPSVAYIHEPFNKRCRPGICSANFPYWFAYVSKENEAEFHQPIANTLAFRYDLIEEIKSLTNTRDAARMMRDYTKFLIYRFRNSKPLLKDPIALFSAEWLASKYNMDVIILIRHPAAFAQSLKRKNWTFEFANFLKQPLLMNDHLYPFETEIRDYSNKEYDVIDQAALLWKIAHYMIMKYQAKHKDWIFVRHEDLSNEPLTGFKNIFEKLNLEFSMHVKNLIKKHSSTDNPIESDANKSLKNDISRNSKAIITSWKNCLDVSELNRIRTKVEGISNVFYSEEDW